MKLHLGCGETRLEGYVNIDQPPPSHTVQSRSVADQYADITRLRYPEGSVEEVRLHHVFEHFSRPTAIGLAASWASWLSPRGRLHIEVPDFVRTARAVLWPFSSRHARLVGIRHLFGSHEAPWAVHCEGWSAATLSGVLEVCGLEIERVRRRGWKGTYNLEVFGRKRGHGIGWNELEPRARAWLRDYLLDDTPGELKLLDVWMSELRGQLERTWALPRAT
jgi:hypothetical protein